MKEFTYFLKFEDGTTFSSPDVTASDPMWATDFSLKPISELYFRIGPHIFALKGFEKYNFFVEASQSLGGGDGSTKLEKLFWCGAHQGHICLFSVNLRTMVIEKFIKAEGREYGGSPTRGWRPGVFGKEPMSGYQDLTKDRTIQ